MRFVFGIALVPLLTISTTVLAILPKCGSENLLNSEQGAQYYQSLNQLIVSRSDESQAGLVITVPIVFHVVYNTPEQNIPDSLIHQQVQILNDDFKRLNSDTTKTPSEFQGIAGSMNIEFCLSKVDPDGNSSTGIIRIPTSESSFPSVTSYMVPDPVKHTSSGGSDAWNTEDYMNIWVCNLVGSTAYTAPPGNFIDPADDGIVCHFNHVGRSGVAPYGLGRSIVHEMGHWFCLKHIWGDDNGACTGTDFIGDTPDQENWTGGCPTFPQIDACSQTAPGIMFMNYMDYTSDDCRNMFTQGQTAYMENCYATVMADYYLKDKCTPIQTGILTIAPDLQVRRTSFAIEISSSEMIDSYAIFDLSGRMVISSPVNSKFGRIEFTTNYVSLLYVKWVDGSSLATKLAF